MIEFLLGAIWVTLLWIFWVLRRINHNIFTRSIRAKVEHQEILTNWHLLNRSLTNVKHLLMPEKNLDVILRRNAKAFEKEITRSSELLRDKPR